MYINLFLKDQLVMVSVVIVYLWFIQAVNAATMLSWPVRFQHWQNAVFPCSRRNAWTPDESHLRWVTMPGAKGYLREKTPLEVDIDESTFWYRQAGGIFDNLTKPVPRSRHMVNEPEVWPVTSKAIDQTHGPASKANSRSSLVAMEFIYNQNWP